MAEEILYRDKPRLRCMVKYIALVYIASYFLLMFIALYVYYYDVWVYELYPYKSRAEKLQLTTRYINTAMMIFAIIVVVTPILAYLYIRGHEFIITNRRIIIAKHFIGTGRRDFLIEEISDVFVKQGPLARLLNYGEVIPVTQSGFGVGYKFKAGGLFGKLFGWLGIGGAVGSVEPEPMAPSIGKIWGVKDPHRVAALISDLISGYDFTHPPPTMIG